MKLLKSYIDNKSPSFRSHSWDISLAQGRKRETSAKAIFHAFGLFYCKTFASFPVALEFLSKVDVCLASPYNICAKHPDLPLNSVNVWKGNVWQSGRRNSTLPANVYWVCPTCCMMGRNRVHHEVQSENNNDRKTCMSNYTVCKQRLLWLFFLRLKTDSNIGPFKCGDHFQHQFIENSNCPAIFITWQISWSNMAKN